MNIFSRFCKHVTQFFYVVTHNDDVSRKAVTKKRLTVSCPYTLVGTQLIRPERDPSEPHDFFLKTRDCITVVEVGVVHVVLELRRPLDHTIIQKAMLLVTKSAWDSFMREHRSYHESEVSRLNTKEDADRLLQKFGRKNVSKDILNDDK